MRAALAALALVVATSGSALAQDAGARRPRAVTTGVLDGGVPRAAPRRRIARADSGITAETRAPRARGAADARTRPEPGAEEREPSPSPRPRRAPLRAEPTEAAPAPSEPTAPEPSPAPPAQLVEPSAPDLLDGGVPPLDGEVPAAWLDGAIEHEDGGVLAELDAGPPDAGVPAEPDAGPPTPEPEPALEDRDRGGMLDYGLEILDRLGMLERQQREGGKRGAVRTATDGSGATAAEDEGDEPTRVQIVLDDDLREWLGLAEPERRFSTFGLLVLLAVCVLALFALTRLRAPLPDRGLFPRALGALHLAARLATIVLVLMLASRLLPTWLHPALRLTLAAAAIAIGFGAVWTLLPDVLGGVVLLTEGRLRPGQWLVGEGFAGTIEQVGPRVTVLRGADGALVTVPNRVIVKTAVRASDRRWHEVEVELRAPAGAAADEVRHAIRDAVASSPYVPPDPGLVLSRDPREPDRWRLEVRLLDVRYAAPFEGELLERVEEALAREADGGGP